MSGLISFLLFFYSLTLFCQEPTEQGQAATVAQCLQDLQSKDPLTRRAAALLIGKYDTPEARQALLECLHDPDSLIRQSALVSLTDDGMQLPPEADEEILHLLIDEDVHVRRIASSLLPRISRGPRIIGANIVIRGNLQIPNTEQTVQARKYLNLALLDEDRSVRRNILLAAGYFPGLLQAENLLPFLQDDSIEIQVLALRALTRCDADKAFLAAQLQPLLHSPHAALRKELVTAAANFAEPGLPLLQTLAKDPQDDVRLAAIGHLARDHSPENFALLQTALLDENIAAELRRPLVNQLRFYADMGTPVLEALMQSRSADLRLAALRILATQGKETFSAPLFLTALQDENLAIRRQAMSVLRRNKYRLSQNQALSLLKSEFADIRSFCFQLVEDEALLLEMAPLAILDDVASVRRAALQVYARQKPENYQDMLIAALQDEDNAIQEMAASHLTPLCRQPEVKDALLEFLPRCQNQRLKSRLQRILKIAPATP
ncbi:MAG: hypothetical protein GX946_03985 [Oligosphaeraceae bacterium]|nr:hypothetical protein [Oligosphaeraceae bacterium]